MKHHFTLYLLALLLPGTAKAAVILTVTSNIPIPQNHAGLYLNVFTGATAGSEPVNWNLEPWMNPFQGGVYVGNSLYLRPVIKGADQIVNLAPGTMIDNTRTYAPGQSGSDKHMGPAADQFQPNSIGYIGFQMQSSPTADICYGWLQVTFNNTGAGSITSYAYETIPGQAIAAGFPIPEPSGALLLCAGAAAALSRRRPLGVPPLGDLPRTASPNRPKVKLQLPTLGVPPLGQCL